MAGILQQKRFIFIFVAARLCGFSCMVSNTSKVEHDCVRLYLGGGFRLRRRFLQEDLDGGERNVLVLMGEASLGPASGVGIVPDASTSYPQPNQVAYSAPICTKLQEPVIKKLCSYLDLPLWWLIRAR